MFLLLTARAGYAKEGYVKEMVKEEFNCSEDYFKDATGDNLTGGDRPCDCCYSIFKCMVCGWSFTSTYSEMGSRLDAVDKMRDHVHLKHA